jgi:hypothetical protein
VTTAVDVGCYVFGIVDAGARLPTPLDISLAKGLRLVEHGSVAAVVSTPPDDRPLGKGSDLLDHDRLLSDLVAGGTSVLPMRFGTVLPDEETVVSQLLAARHDELRQQLADIRGTVQYTVKARYDQEPVLREIVASNPRIAALRERGAASFDDQVQLGESVVRALAELRAVDGPALLEELGEARSRREYELAEPEEVLRASYLVPVADIDAFEQQVERAGERRAGRIRIRLIGPSPAYDFVGED